MSSLADTTLNVAREYGEPGSDLLVIFGGIHAGVGIPVFEFLNFSRRLAVDKLFLRDLEQAWYHLGIGPDGSSIPEIARFLQAELTERRPRRCVFTGNSAGGYAALLFGSLLRPQAVVAFSPQTFVDPENRRRLNDDRWPAQMKRLHGSGRMSAEHADLLTFLMDRPAAATRSRVLYAQDDPLDALHARRLAAVPGIELEPHASGTHDLVRQLRDQGSLDGIFVAAFATGDHEPLPPRA